MFEALGDVLYVATLHGIRLARGYPEVSGVDSLLLEGEESMFTRSRGGPTGPGFRTSIRFAVCALMCSWILLPLVAAAEGDAGNEGDESPGRITFVGKNMLVTANGVFHEWKLVESQLALDAVEGGHVVIEIDLASLDTGIKRRDNHLRSADFFEVERWPKARVRVHSASQVEGSRYRAKFDIEIRDITKTIAGEFEIVSRTPLAVRGSLLIDRTDFGVGKPESWNPLSVTNEIAISFEAVLAD